MKEQSYQKGFGNYFESECLPVLQSQNSPQAIPFGLYAEQLSGTAFTVPRHEQQRTWLYRIRPSVVHSPFIPYDLPRFCAVTPNNSVVDPNQIRWNPIQFCYSESDFIHGVTTIAGQGDPGFRSGLAIHVYSFNKNMENKAINNSDGDFLFVLQDGTLSFRTEMGIITASPGEIVVIQRGIRFSVDLCDGSSRARGYILEIYDRHFELPELGPIGSNGLAYPHDFLYPTASYQDLDNISFEIYNKYQGKFFKSSTQHSCFDVVAWKGNYCPFKYDLKKFNTINTVSFDHPDPSIFTVLTVKSGQAGVALADFVIFPPRWMVAENTFRPPWFHRNCMAEYMGLISGSYDAKKEGFLPGGGSLHSIAIPHGPDSDVFSDATKAALKPVKLPEDGLAFMFETNQFLQVTKFAMEEGGVVEIQKNYAQCWQGMKKFFDPANPSAGPKDLAEAEELVNFIKSRASIQEQFASKLLELKYKEISGFQFDETRLLSVVFHKYKSETETLSLAHKQISQDLVKLIRPIEDFIQICKREMTPRAEHIHQGWKKYQKLVDECRALEAKASLKWSLISSITVADEIDELVPELNLIQIGDKNIPADDFNELLAKMQNEVPSEDIWKLLGTYKDSYNGELLLGYLKKIMTDAEALEFLTYLATKGYIKSVSYTASESTFSRSAFYQWKISAAEFPNESATKKDKRDATKLSMEALRSAKQVDQLRQSLNIQMYEYTSQCQKLMADHINQIKYVILQALESEKIPIQAIRTMNENCQVFLESLDAEKTVSAIIEKDRTGIKLVPTFVLKTFPGIEYGNVFGVSLEEATSRCKTRIVPLVQKCISYLSSTFAVPGQISQLELWIQPNANLQAIHALRTLLNTGTNTSRKSLRKFSVETIIGVLKLYLMELPVSLVTDEIYESLKMLYLSKGEDKLSNRLGSVRNLLSTMPQSHFYTLAYLVGYWNGMAVLEESELKISIFCEMLGPYILRAERDTNVTLNDKHPVRLARDLVLHATEVISPDILTPSSSAADLLNRNVFETSPEDDESQDDEASMRVLFDPNPRPSSIAESFISASTKFTKKTMHSSVSHDDGRRETEVQMEIIASSSTA